ncbi:MAG: type II secretion system F family protein [Planctomycetota bacterium]
MSPTAQDAARVLCPVLWALATVSLLVYIGPVWDSLARHKYHKQLDRGERLGIDQNAMLLGLRLWGVTLTSVVVALWWYFRMPPVALAVGWLIYVTPHYVLNYVIGRRATLLRDQMASAATGVANTVRCGMGIAEGLQEVADDTPVPLADELRTIVREFRLGRPLKDALESVRSRLQLEPFTLFAAAVQVSLDRGGRLNEALDRISTSLEDYQRLERKMQAETASNRRVVAILAAFPVFFLAVFYAFDPQSTGLLFRPPAGFFPLGHYVLAAVIMLTYLGVRMAINLTTLKL